MPPIRVSRTGWFPDQVRKTMKEHIAAKKKKNGNPNNPTINCCLSYVTYLHNNIFLKGD